MERQTWGSSRPESQQGILENRLILLCTRTMRFKVNQINIHKICLLHNLKLNYRKYYFLSSNRLKQNKQCKMMVTISDSLPLLFSAKLLTDVHLTRNLPTQHYDLRQSVWHYKSKKRQEWNLATLWSTLLHQCQYQILKNQSEVWLQGFCSPPIMENTN